MLRSYTKASDSQQHPPKPTQPQPFSRFFQDVDAGAGDDIDVITDEAVIGSGFNSGAQAGEGETPQCRYQRWGGPVQVSGDLSTFVNLWLKSARDVLN